VLGFVLLQLQWNRSGKSKKWKFLKFRHPERAGCHCATYSEAVKYKIDPGIPLQVPCKRRVLASIGCLSPCSPPAEMLHVTRNRFIPLETTSCKCQHGNKLQAKGWNMSHQEWQYLHQQWEEGELWPGTLSDFAPGWTNHRTTFSWWKDSANMYPSFRNGALMKT